MGDRDSERHKILDSVDTKKLFGRDESAIIEWNIDNIVKEAKDGKFKRYTVDKAPLRTKYFFGEGYTYGGQLQRGAGNEKLYPKGEVDPIPDWIKELVIKPVEESGIVRSGWINSAVINDYLPGGCIVSHIDPPQLFSRPIITVSFFSDSFLSFGCKFSFKPIRVTKPIAQVPVRRGGVLSMYGYSANQVTHCIRPEDIESRRAVIILRHVPHTAPRMTDDDMEHFRKQEEAKKKDSSPSRSNVFIVDTRRRAWPDYQQRPRRSYARFRSRSRERYGNAGYQDYRRRRSYSRERIRSRSRSKRRSRDRTYDRRDRSYHKSRSQSRSTSRQRRSRSRSASSSSQSDRDEYCRSPSLDKFGRNKVMQNVYHGLKHRGITSMSSRTVDKFLQRQNGRKEKRISSRSASRSRSRSSSRSRSRRRAKSRVRDRVKEEINKKVPVSKNVQSAILKNIIGSFKDNDDSSDSDGTVSDVVNKITTNNKLDKEEDFKDRLQKLKMKITDEVKAGKHGNIKIEETKDDKQKGLEKEVEDLKKELKELKEHLNEKNETSSSSSESESEDEPVSVLDIFKTTILQKSKKSTIYIDKKNKKSKLVETKTQKILKERIKMLKNK